MTDKCWIVSLKDGETFMRETLDDACELVEGIDEWGNIAMIVVLRTDGTWEDGPDELLQAMHERAEELREEEENADFLSSPERTGRI